MYAESYQRAHGRVVALMDGKDPDVMVPACPDWSAGDVVRHLCGLSVDLVNGAIDGFASDAWTDKQVRTRAGMEFDEVVDEWSGAIDAAASVLDNLDSLDLGEGVDSPAGSFPASAFAPMAIGDILHHEFDLRNAYGDSTGRDLIEVHVAAAGHVRSIRRTFAEAGLPTIRIESTDTATGWDIGFGDPVATLRAPSFELMRAIGGRRTREEMRAMDWDGDADPFLDALVLPHLSPPLKSLNE